MGTPTRARADSVETTSCHERAKGVQILLSAPSFDSQVAMGFETFDAVVAGARLQGTTDDKVVHCDASEARGDGVVAVDDVIDRLGRPVKRFGDSRPGSKATAQAARCVRGSFLFGRSRLFGHGWAFL